MDGTGIESRWRRDLSHPSRQVLGPTQPAIQWVPDHLPGGKAAEVKVRVELYIYSLSGPSWPVLGRTLPFTFLFFYYSQDKTHPLFRNRSSVF